MRQPPDPDLPPLAQFRERDLTMTLKRTLLSTMIVALLGTAGVAWADGDIAAGKAKATSCAMCHGANGEGSGSNPPLAGMKQAQFVQAMKDFKSGKRSNAMMKNLASGLSNDEVENIAAYYASLKGK
jgi:cytochrome c553